jgi:hypothetical protein
MKGCVCDAYVVLGYLFYGKRFSQSVRKLLPTISSAVLWCAKGGKFFCIIKNEIGSGHEWGNSSRREHRRELLSEMGVGRASCDSHSHSQAG